MILAIPPAPPPPLELPVALLSTDQWLVLLGFAVSITMYVVTIKSSNKQVASQLAASNQIMTTTLSANNERMTTQLRASNDVLNSKLELIDGTMEDFKQEIKKLNEVLVAQATQNARITFMEERILQQGKRLDGIATAVNRILFKLAMPDPVAIDAKMTIHGND